MCDDEYPSDLSSPEDIEIVCAWDDACTAWLKDAGSQWPGCQKNRQLLTAKIIALGLESAADKRGVLTIAFDELQKENALVEPEDENEDWWERLALRSGRGCNEHVPLSAGGV